jgi:hypothetical protein
MALPAFALVGGYADFGRANFAGGAMKCNFPQYTNPCPPEAFNNTRQTVHVGSGVFGDLEACHSIRFSSIWRRTVRLASHIE